MKKIFFLTLAFILGLNLQNLNAQCGTGCTTTLNNYTSSSNYTFASGLTCFTGTSTINNDVVFSSGSSICVGTGATVSFGGNNYTFSSPTTTVNIDVFGTMNVNQNPTWTGNVNIIVHSSGTLNIGPSPNFGTITLKGAKMDITNDGTFNVGTIQFQQSGATITITNNSTMTVTSTLNIENGNAYFKNNGSLTIEQNYNSNSTSVYVNCGTYTGKFNLKSGGKVINTGTFNTSQIDYGGPTSRVENYGRFNVSGNINLGGSGSVFYNEGITTFTAGQFSSDGNLQGPSDASKTGYFIWPSSNKANMNSGSIGPNLNFSTNSGNSNDANMFNNTGSLTWLSGITWGGTQQTTLPATDCPQPDGTPAVPVPTSTSVCAGIDLTSLQTAYSNITYEWWTGNSTTRTTQITSSTSPSVSNYTTAGTVYLWAKNVSSGVYSASGAAVTVNALPTITLSSSAINVCYRAFAQTTNLTYSATTGSPTTYNITWNSSPANSFASVSNATLNASPISISVPAGTVAGTYTGYLTVKNASSCSSTSSTFTVTINKCPRLCLVSNKMVTPKIKR